MPRHAPTGRPGARRTTAPRPAGRRARAPSSAGMAVVEPHVVTAQGTPSRARRGHGGAAPGRDRVRGRSPAPTVRLRAPAPRPRRSPPATCGQRRAGRHRQLRADEQLVRAEVHRAQVDDAVDPAGRVADERGARCAATSAGDADSPTSRLFVSTTSTTATATSSAPMAQVPMPSHTASPVSSASPTPASANTRPMRAATSSSSTTGSSGFFACRMKPTQLSPPLSVARLAHRGAQREALEPDGDHQHDDRDQRRVEVVRVADLLDALVEREQPAGGEQHQRDEEAVDVAVAAVAEGCSRRRLPPRRARRRAAAAPGCPSRPPSARPRPASTPSR